MRPETMRCYMEQSELLVPSMDKLALFGFFNEAPDKYVSDVARHAKIPKAHAHVYVKRIRPHRFMVPPQEFAKDVRPLWEIKEKKYNPLLVGLKATAPGSADEKVFLKKHQRDLDKHWGDWNRGYGALYNKVRGQEKTAALTDFDIDYSSGIDFLPAWSNDSEEARRSVERGLAEWKKPTPPKPGGFFAARKQKNYQQDLGSWKRTRNAAYRKRVAAAHAEDTVKTAFETDAAHIRDGKVYRRAYSNRKMEGMEPDTDAGVGFRGPEEEAKNPRAYKASLIAQARRGMKRNSGPLGLPSISSEKRVKRRKHRAHLDLAEKLATAKTAGLFSKKDKPRVRPKVEVLVHDGKGGLLVAKKGKSYSFPGGGLDGDSVADAARKEVLEEVGYAISKPRRVGVSPKTIMWDTPSLQKKLNEKRRTWKGGYPYEGSKLHYRAARATGRDMSLYGSQGDQLEGAAFVPIDKVIANLEQNARDQDNPYIAFEGPKLQAVKNLKKKLKREKTRKAVADVLLPGSMPNLKSDSTPVLIAKALRDATLVAGGASAGYFTAGAVDYPLRHHTSLPQKWRALPLDAKKKILRTAGGVTGIGLAATYLATRAMHNRARYHERNPNQD